MRVSERALEDVRRRLLWDTPYYAKHCLRIINKSRRRVPLVPKAEQLRFDRVLEAQRLAGKPERAIILKSRQIGFSTWVQAKLIQRVTQLENHEALVVAHDRKTTAKLFRMADLMYKSLPADPALAVKPTLQHTKKDFELRFGESSRFRQLEGEFGMNSGYLVDTANEGDAGRGATYSEVHLSELAFWADIEKKMGGVMEGVPEELGTLVVIESTPNGFNDFKDLWDDAVQGRNEYAAFFSPWFKDPSYSRPFESEAAKEAFILRVGSGPYGQDEPMLLELLAREGIEDPYERLHWRRHKIASPSMKGKLSKFKQEYAATPEEAFISTGSKVFEGIYAARLVQATEKTDPRVVTDNQPGPRLGTFEVTRHAMRKGRHGMVEVPTKWEWRPKGFLDDPDADSVWRVWQEPRKDGQYVVALDPSEGEENDRGESSWMGIQVIDHETREQVAEFRTRMEAHPVAKQLYVAAHHWNRAVVIVERTGGYGTYIVSTLYHDWKYPRHLTYFSKPAGSQLEKEGDRLGWSTNLATKGVLVAHGQELLHEDCKDFEVLPSLVKSRLLAQEHVTYVREPNGRMRPEKNSFADLLMAWLIGQYAAYQMPVRPKRDRSQPLTTLSEATRERWLIR